MNAEEFFARKVDGLQAELARLQAEVEGLRKALQETAEMLTDARLMSKLRGWGMRPLDAAIWDRTIERADAALAAPKEKPAEPKFSDWGVKNPSPDSGVTKFHQPKAD